jgi:hypothetical protein
MTTQQLNPNAVALLKKLSTDPNFLRSLEKATTPAERWEQIRRAGLDQGFTNDDVKLALGRIAPAPLGAGATLPGSGKKRWVNQLTGVVEAVGQVFAPS